MTGPVLLALRIVLAASLYGFLFLALWVLWRDLRRQVSPQAGSGIPAITLTRLNSDPADKGVYRFETSEVLIGRDPTCNVRLDDKTISARHARLSYHHKQWWVEDLRSTNGAFLNTEGILEPIVIASGDQLRCGGVEFDITVEE
jgi:pSer/pThr/pTyr-binding forkhead associated (FHA) protein